MIVLMCAPRLCGHRRSQPLCRRARAPPLLPPQITVFQRAGSGGVSSAQLMPAGRRCTCWVGWQPPLSTFQNSESFEQYVFAYSVNTRFQLFTGQKARQEAVDRRPTPQKDSNQKTSAFLGTASVNGGRKERTNGGGRHHPPTMEDNTQGCPCLLGHHDTEGKVPVPCTPSASAAVLSPHSRAKVVASPVNFS